MTAPSFTRARVLSAALVLALAACAHASSGPSASRTAAPRAAAPGAPPPELGPVRPEYVLVTGSRIPQRVDPETGQLVTTSPVRVYDQAELEQTGRPETADALRALDPGLRQGPGRP